MNRIKNKKLVFALMVAITVVFIGCIPRYLIPNDTDLKTAQTHWSSATAPQLKQGYNIYIDQCTDCHRLKKLKKYTEGDWLKVMPKMGRKAHLDSAQYSNVLHYILAKREDVMAGKKK